LIGGVGSRIITDDEKATIKSFLLHSSFEETNKKVVLQMALLMAKVRLLLLLILPVNGINLINIIFFVRGYLTPIRRDKLFNRIDLI
jgi:hypothetical protein